MPVITTHGVEPPPAYSVSEHGGIDNPGFVSGGDIKKKNPADVQWVLGLSWVELDVDDIWALPELVVDFTPWAELTTFGKLKRVLWHYLGKLVLLLGLLYLFICSLSFLSDAFKLLGGKTAGRAFSDSEILSNPVAGLMMGVLGTVLLQSSSTTTSIVVSMVGSDIITVRLAIPIVMGANIGTSVTNTIVSIGQIANKHDFRRAFAGATVHDIFNWLSVIILLPIEVLTGYLEHISEAIVTSMHLTTNEDADQDYLKVITKPLTKLIVQSDKKVITKIATGALKDEGQSIIKHCCDKVKVYEMVNTTIADANGTLVNVTNKGEQICSKQCVFLFEKVSRGPDGWSDSAVGAVLLLIALVILCVCLVGIVKTLHSLLKGSMAVVIRKFVNADFPGYCSYLTGYLAIAIGAGLTVLVQSSSIFTSSLTPLVGMGVISIERMYPLTLGANIGTTATGILAAFAQDSSGIQHALQVALCHLFFNISGILIWYPIPKLRLPVPAAKFLGEQTSKYRWFAVAYLILMFFVVPAAGFGLSSASWIALAVVFIPIFVIGLVVMLIKLVQSKKPSLLPAKLRSWKWLPVWLRSLAPYDRVFVKMTCNCICCRKAHCCKSIYMQADELHAEGAGNKGADAMNGKMNGNMNHVSGNGLEPHKHTEAVCRM